MASLLSENEPTSRKKKAGRPKGSKSKEKEADNEAPKLPEGAIQETSVQSDTESFRAVVEQSKNTLHNEEIKKVKVKARGPGRPKKDEGQPSVAPATNSSTSAPENSSVNKPLDLTPYLIVPIQALSKIPANNTGIEELMFSVDEAGACAHSLNEVLNAFAPAGQLNPKTAAILGAFSTFGSIGFMKYQIYLEKRKIREDFSKEEIEPEIKKQENMISAEDHFRKN